MKALDLRARSGGYTLIELMMVVAIIALVTMIAVPLYTGAIDKSHRSALVHDTGELYRAFMRYYVDAGVFPAVSSPASRVMNLQTLEPLSSEGYFTNFESYTHKIANGQLRNYDSPNVGGADTQFWATVNSKRQPGFVLLIAHTNDLPINRGEWYDGVYYVTPDGVFPVKETK